MNLFTFDTRLNKRILRQRQPQQATGSTTGQGHTATDMQFGTIVCEQMRDQNKSGRIHRQSQSRTNGMPPRQPSFESTSRLLQRTDTRGIRARERPGPRRTRTEPRRYQTQQRNTNDYSSMTGRYIQHQTAQQPTRKGGRKPSRR